MGPNELKWEDPKNLMHISLKEPFENCLRLAEDQRPNCIYDKVSGWNPTNMEAYQFLIKILFNVLEKVDGRRELVFVHERTEERKKGCRKRLLQIAIRFAEGGENEALEDVAKIIAILRAKDELDEIFLGPLGQDTLLTYAVYLNQIAIVKILLEANANIDAQAGDGRTALMRAAAARNLEIVELLLEEKADVEIQSDGGYTALMTAVGTDRVSAENLEIVKALLAKNAKVNIQTMNGVTAFMKAARIGNIEIMEVLMKAKADVDIPDKYGSTVLMNVACVGFAENVKFILDHGGKAKINVQDDKGETALMKAVFWGDIETVKVLLAAGAEKETTRNRDGKTAVQLAEILEYGQIVDAINSF